MSDSSKGCEANMNEEISVAREKSKDQIAKDSKLSSKEATDGHQGEISSNTSNIKEDTSSRRNQLQHSVSSPISSIIDNASSSTQKPVTNVTASSSHTRNSSTSLLPSSTFFNNNSSNHQEQCTGFVSRSSRRTNSSSTPAQCGIAPVIPAPPPHPPDCPNKSPPTLLFTWAIRLSGLVPVGTSVSQVAPHLAPNTMLFQFSGMYSVFYRFQKV